MSCKRFIYLRLFSRGLNWWFELPVPCLGGGGTKEDKDSFEKSGGGYHLQALTGDGGCVEH